MDSIGRKGLDFLKDSLKNKFFKNNFYESHHSKLSPGSKGDRKEIGSSLDGEKEDGKNIL